MRYARVVLGIPIEGPFDYLVPRHLERKIKTGMRAWVPLRTRKMVGYVVKLSRQTKIKHPRPILGLIDEFPVLGRNMLLLTRELSEYYCCSWGEAIETALPPGLRKGKILLPLKSPKQAKNSGRKEQEVILAHSADSSQRWNIYLEQIKETLTNHKSVIVLLTDRDSLLKAQERIKEELDAPFSVLYRKEPRELEEWQKISSGEVNLVLGARSGIFAPVNNLGLIIIDEEEGSVYKQEQVPHYHCRQAAFMRSRIEKAKLILGSASPSLESFYSTRKNKIKYVFSPAQAPSEIKIIDMRKELRFPKAKGAILSKYLADALLAALNSKDKILLFLNRKGFATSASCHNCGATLRCPRCNINLVYHFKAERLNCHYCNFKMEPPKICPACNSGYIKFSGAGTEKIESELSRIFPQARIKTLEAPEKIDINEADIFVATSAVIRQASCRFGLAGVLGIDNSLNRIDLRASEKAFALLAALAALSEKKLIIQSNFAGHHCFQALLKNDMNIFYEKELKYRKQLGFPPYKHMVLVKLRGKKEERVKEASHSLFQKLNQGAGDRGTRVLSVNPAQPAKLRGNYCWQVLITSDNVKKTNRFLKINLKNFAHSGIIVTVDVDPL